MEILPQSMLCTRGRQPAFHDVQRRAPVVPHMRQPRPQHPVRCGQTQTLPARATDGRQLVAEGGGFPSVRDARDRSKNRSEWRSEGHDEASVPTRKSNCSRFKALRPSV